jgi:dTDP-4-amino-4,6-dideoxygalactose transaminase
MGFNFKFTDVQAALALAQLTRIKEREASLITVYKRYSAGLSDCSALKLLSVDMENGEIPLYAEILCERRDSLIRHLASRGIQSRPFYPNLSRAIHLGQPQSFPNASVFEKEGLFLPCGPDQPIQNVDEVIAQLKSWSLTLDEQDD